LRVAEHEDSTRETYLGYIERTIKPDLDSMPISKLWCAASKPCTQNCAWY
jgi:hypothetical protein